ncbi:MAG: bifunctional serine/threonine-protein kinase/formylglycine-generating enzyme family protein [Ignavibacterium sp.]
MKIGNTILHYKIIDKLGEGGMGIVYKAEDTKLKREVAIKFLPHSFNVSEKDKQRLRAEAQVAAGLNHPNIATVYSIEESGDDTFIVMEYVKGNELRNIIKSNPDKKIHINDFLNYAIQITDGLNAAHKKGIIHRDIKSSNIMLSDDGRISIMDFGLAHIHGDPMLTKNGSTPGTTAYMSPEQLRGEETDFKSDIWSLGIVFYEMLTGQQPFQGNFDQAIIYSILHEKPKSVRKINPEVSEELEQIVLQCLEKDPKKRIQSAEELLNRLKEIQSNISVFSSNKFSSSRLKIRKADLVVSAIIVAIIIILVAFLPITKLFKSENLPELRNQLQNLVDKEKYFEAYQLAEEKKIILQNDSVFKQLSLFIYDTLSVTSEPSGAKVYLLRYNPDKNDSISKGELIGETPIKNYQLARGDYLITLEKNAEPIDNNTNELTFPFGRVEYIPVKKVASSYPIMKEFPVPVRGIKVNVKFYEKEKVPENMVPVPGGKHKLVSSSLQLQKPFTLSDFFIDKYEVSNADFKNFISAGGYKNKIYWKHPFIKDGKEISWQEAMKLFVDQTNLPGPRSWNNQNYPDGKDKYPVTDISWYEAAAYAEFLGKSLPTIYQWEKAARNGVPNYHSTSMPWGLIYPDDDLSGRTNFNSKGTVPVDRYDFGISYYGCYNTAGNVEEWCLNKSTNGFVYAAGSFEDSNYVFGTFKSVDGFYSSPTLGFRCVKNLSTSKSDQGNITVNFEQKIPVYQPVDDSKFASIKSLYDYTKTKINSKIILREENQFWIKEKISFNSPLGDSIMGYLFLPKNAVRPFQCIVWNPHSGVYKYRYPANWAAEKLYSENIKYGRALFVIVPKGSPERKWEYGENIPAKSSSLFRDHVIRWVTEQKIVLDYLTSRSDIDSSKIAYIATANDYDGFIVPGVENRFKCNIIIASGIYEEDQKIISAEINPVNFLPRYEAPTYMMHGKYDEAVYFSASVMPAYNLLPEPKKLEALNTTHVPPLSMRVPLINNWLDETLGKVKLK